MQIPSLSMLSLVWMVTWVVAMIEVNITDARLF